MPIKAEHLKIILEGLTEAWSELVAKGLESLTAGIEDEVTALLAPKLNNYCQSQQRWKDIVQSASRGSEMVNFDGSKLKKEPDLPLVLRLRNANFPLIAECKIIDHPNGKTTKLYCDQGIARFVCGDYAWAEQEAIMLAYVRDGSTVAEQLTPQMTKSAKSKPDPLQTESNPAACPDIHPTAHRSDHMRSFSYLPEAGGGAPGSIALFHLWLTS